MFKKIYLETGNVCNLSCAFCPGTKRAPRFMTAEEFRFLAGRLQGHTEYLYFHLMGEPLLHPQLDSLLDIAGELGFKVIITTNGTLLDEKGFLLLAASALHKVNISLQSFEANSGGELEEYVRSCALFARKAAGAGKLCVLRLWNRKGMDALNCRIKAALGETFPQPWRELRQGTALFERVWLEPGDKFDWPELEAEELGESCFCHGLRDHLGVLCDGRVVPCCLDHEGDITLGNLFESSLEDIMSTKRARAIYEGFSKRQAVEELCRKCGYARRFT